MEELYRYALIFFSTLLSRFAFVPHSQCVTPQTMVTVGTRLAALGVMLVMLSA